MTRKQKRLTVIGGAHGFPGAGRRADLCRARPEDVLFLHAGRSRQQATVAPGQRIRLGGLVEEGTVERGDGTPGCPSR